MVWSFPLKQSESKMAREVIHIFYIYVYCVCILYIYTLCIYVYLNKMYLYNVYIYVSTKWMTRSVWMGSKKDTRLLIGSLEILLPARRGSIIFTSPIHGTKLSQYTRITIDALDSFSSKSVPCCSSTQVSK